MGVATQDKLELPDLAGIERAHEQLAPYMEDTPLVRCELLSRALSADVWIKNETVTPIASFKLRGALTHLLRARDLRGAVTSSTGNHGQGVAYGARLLGVPSHIFLPAVNNPVKRAMIRAFGATLHEIGIDIDAAKDAARDFAAEHGLEFVDDGESLDMMEGAGTTGLECVRKLDGIDWFFVPMGRRPCSPVPPPRSRRCSRNANASRSRPRARRRWWKASMRENRSRRRSIPWPTGWPAASPPIARCRG